MTGNQLEWTAARAGRPSQWDDWVDRIQPVEADLREIFRGADYFLPLTVGNLPEEADVSQYELTGLTWPSTKQDPSSAVSLEDFPAQRKLRVSRRLDHRS